MAKVYLASIQISERDESLRQRLIESVPLFEETIKRLSGGEYRLALRSKNGSMFAWLLKSSHDARHIVTQLYAPGSNRPMFNDYGDASVSGSKMHDKFMVIEVGRDMATINNNMVTTWAGRTFQSL